MSPPPEAVAGVLERWHEFYLLAGTAAVTLVGLLFVALSFHLDALLDDTRAHLLVAARGAFSSYLYVMVFSLMALVPGQSLRIVATWALFSSVAFAVFYLLSLRTARGRRDGAGHDRFLGRRRRMVLLLYALTAIDAAFMFRSRDPVLVLQFMPLIVLQLANAAWTSWDLLVQVGRMRRDTGPA